MVGSFYFSNYRKGARFLYNVQSRRTETEEKENKKWA